MFFGEDKKRFVVPDRAEQRRLYDAQASIFKRRMSVVYPVSREHVKALNMSVHLCVDKKVTQTVAWCGVGLSPPTPARHFRSHQWRCDPFPAATPYLTELLSKFLFLYFL